MEYLVSPSTTNPVKCCDCGCNCCLPLDRSFSGTVLRSVKRKYDEFEEESQFTIPGLMVPQNARVDIENECVALRETVASQQETIQDLICELEEEMNASSTATNETMSMILRLQREKAEIEMEAKQFKRFAEEKIEHDQQEILELEELVYKREHTIEALTCEIQAYKHRLMSYGFTEAEAEAEIDEYCLQNEEKIMSENYSTPMKYIEGQPVLPGYDIYPPLKCNINDSHLNMDGCDETDDVYKHETPYYQDELNDLERRINQLEDTPRTIRPDGEYRATNNVFENVVVGQSPRQKRHLRKISNGDSNSPLVKEMGADYSTLSPKLGGGIKKPEFSNSDVASNLKEVDNASEVGGDMCDRIYTVDSIHRRATNGVMDHKTSTGVGRDGYVTSPRELQTSARDLEIQKLYARLHALEADRETMRQAIVSIGTDKAQLVLLKEIAQNLCKEMSPARARPVQEKSIIRSFSFLSLFKWVISILLWRRKARRCRYSFGLSTNNVGLLTLINRNPRVGAWRVLFSTNLQS